MNILGAIFPLGNFLERNNSEQSILDELQSTFSFARTCLLRGDADQCFRSLLFQSSLSYASIGKRVCFYTPVPIQTIPSLVHKLIPKSLLSANLDLIQFHYLPTLFDVHANLITTTTCDIIIIDGYLEFPLFKQEDLFTIISACALLKDTYEYLRNKFLNKDLILLCSCTCSEAWMANVEQRGLFDLSIHVDMLENGDYHANIHALLKKQVSCAFDFRITCNEIMPLFATIQHHNK
ncbi:unnamed protein product [Rotaria magnacalcarata]|uniref:Uncharacterized protein n=2 Tax=Rotaria magnacalcarata TaxID=392030 RepID=A0A818ZVN4_9BILA|nr:unnamed protein product [Rotaria magnacalcarata]CAF1530725.1 unnamed protein product [Rotaria magnacalcarata]CAF1935845.1 unnamed protein product [Rotaria magnacalcarata]CAF2022404.1 unnamed protein product [Rotaria magnacalcarata]CAF3769385.1 unnamed protein product [Rotaria magnacalcarata]